MTLPSPHDGPPEKPVPALAGLIALARRGDGAAADMLFKRYRPYLRVVCATRLPQFFQKREDASDIVQQTLLDATRGLPEFRGESEGEFEVWMAKLLERNILQSVRRHTARKRDVRREARDLGSHDSATLIWHSIASEKSDVRIHIFRGETALQLADALERLPEDQQICVEMRYLQQMPLKVIADYVDKTTGAVAGLIRRGIESLRELLPDDANVCE